MSAHAAPALSAADEADVSALESHGGLLLLLAVGQAEEAEGEKKASLHFVRCCFEGEIMVYAMLFVVEKLAMVVEKGLLDLA